MRLHEDGNGVLVERYEMINDKILYSKNSFCTFVKNDIRDVSDDFFRQVRNTECNEEMYETNYDKPMDVAMKKVTAKYCKNPQYLAMSMEPKLSDSKTHIM